MPPPAAEVAPAPQLAANDRDYVAPDAEGWGRAGQLRFLELLPNGGSRSQELPLVVMIHGMGDHPATDWFEGFDAGQPVRVIMPQAPTPYFDGFSWFTYNVRAYNAPEPLAREIAHAADLIRELTDIVARRHPTRGLPIVAGFSQGGMLSYALALRAPDRMRLAIPIAGELPDPLWPTQPATGKRLPIRSLHGTADNVIVIDGARKLIERLKSLSYDATLREFPGATHTITPDMQAEMNALLRQQL